MMMMMIPHLVAICCFSAANRKSRYNCRCDILKEIILPFKLGPQCPITCLCYDELDMLVMRNVAEIDYLKFIIIVVQDDTCTISLNKITYTTAMPAQALVYKQLHMAWVSVMQGGYFSTAKLPGYRYEYDTIRKKKLCDYDDHQSQSIFFKC